MAAVMFVLHIMGHKTNFTEQSEKKWNDLNKKILENKIESFIHIFLWNRITSLNK